VSARRPVRWFGVAAAIAALVLAGRLLASNLGFHIEHTLLGPEDSASGTNWLALPWVPAAGLDSASDLFVQLGGAATVEYVARVDPESRGLVTYTGGTENDFALSPGEGLVVKMKETVQYDLIGSHDPVSITLRGPADAMSGDNQYAPPYHGTAKTASALIEDIGSAFVDSVTRWVTDTDGIQSYTGTSGVDFPLVPGHSYRVRVKRTVEYTPTVEP
jgi:hypothetical protein